MKKIFAIGLLTSGILYASTMLGHNLTLSGSINPASGTTITAPETLLSGQFSTSGCGLGGTIEVTATDGDVSPVTQSCNNGTWTWSATWSGYGPGDPTVTATFETYHAGQGGQKFLHYGEVSATYYVVLACDLPDAPAIANHYMHALGITSRDEYNTIIPAVAHAMNNGDFGANACSELYEEKVIAFVDTLLQ